MSHQGYRSKSSRGGNHDKKIYAEKDWKYNGDFHSLDTFNQRVRSELAEKSTLGDKILNGNIEIRQDYVGGKIGWIYRQAGNMGGILTNLMLAIVIVTSADPEGTRARLGDGFKNIFTSKAAKVKVQFEKIFDEGPINYEYMDEETKRATLKKISDDFIKVGTLTEAEKEEMINKIIDEETEDEWVSRIKLGFSTPSDEVKTGILGETDSTDPVVRKFLKSGKIPMDLIRKAMEAINKIVKKYMSNRLLNQTRFKSSTTKMHKNGLEIYQILQKPSQSDLKNIIILTKKIRLVESKEWKDNYEYHQTKLHDLVVQRELAIEAYKETKEIKLSHSDIYCICTAINCIGGNEEAIATNKALLNVDLSKFENMDEWRKHIETYSSLPSGNKKKKVVLL